MRLTRLYIPDTELTAQQTIELSADQSHYVLRVLRMENTQHLALFNSSSGAWQGELIVMGKKASVVLAEQIQKPQAMRDVWLLASPLKKEPWDFCLEKATELGVAAIRPVVMEYTQNTRINDDRARANIIEAAQQSERTHVPEYTSAITFDKLMDGWDATRVLFVALERSDAKTARDVFAQDKNDKAAILIGPEGGFSPRERDILLSKHFVQPISLGTTILRAETAAMAALSVYLL